MTSKLLSAVVTFLSLCNKCKDVNAVFCTTSKMLHLVLELRLDDTVESSEGAPSKDTVPTWQNPSLGLVKPHHPVTVTVAWFENPLYIVCPAFLSRIYLHMSSI